MNYQGAVPDDTSAPCTGILLTNLGTPDAATTADVRRYLKEFLWDPRVVETPRWLWWLILNGIILRTRPKHSAAAYRKVWTDEGSPLLTISQKQATALQSALEQHMDGSAKVVLAMRYGSPSIAQGLEALRRANARRVLILPLYPQYSATTTASTFDAVSQTLQGWRWIPELRFVNHYFDNNQYIKALSESVRSAWKKQGRAERLLISFHGIPQSYADGGDPYPQECKVTATKLAQALNLDEKEWAITFQSRLGRQEWIKPYTDETLKLWGKEGVKSVQVICPGFSADCLETLEEIGEENRNYFLSAGGEEYQYIPALNDAISHIELMTDLVVSSCGGQSKAAATNLPK
ncbi:MAG: ferrochelatase [Sedimenticola sp.]